MAEKTAKKIGRPSKYTPELAAEMCERLSNGEPLRQICRDDHMPFWTRIYDWMGKDEALSIAILGMWPWSRPGRRSSSSSWRNGTPSGTVTESKWLVTRTPP